MYPFDVSDFVGFGPRLRFRDIVRKYPRVTTAPAIPPELLAEAKLHARVSTNAEDAVLNTYLLAAIEAVENDAEMALLQQTRTLFMDFFPAWEMEWRCPPLQSVTALTYLDYTGATQTLASTAYRVDPLGKPAIITPVYGTVWPVAYPVIDAVQVVGVCGATTYELLQPHAKLAIYMQFASRYWNREMSETDETAYWRALDRIRWRYQ